MYSDAWLLWSHVLAELPCLGSGWSANSESCHATTPMSDHSHPILSQMCQKPRGLTGLKAEDGGWGRMAGREKALSKDLELETTLAWEAICGVEAGRAGSQPMWAAITKCHQRTSPKPRHTAHGVKAPADSLPCKSSCGSEGTFLLCLLKVKRTKSVP